MRKKSIFLLLAFFVFPVLAFSQKAYEAVFYSGKTQNITVKFMLADGYVSASEIKTTDTKTKKVSTFLPENGNANDDKKMKFYHYTTIGKKLSDYFILEGIEENYESTPAQFNCTYYYNGKASKITLQKLK